MIEETEEHFFGKKKYLRRWIILAIIQLICTPIHINFSLEGVIGSAIGFALIIFMILNRPEPQRLHRPLGARLGARRPFPPGRGAIDPGRRPLTRFAP